jgi:hypothetical protein
LITVIAPFFPGEKYHDHAAQGGACGPPVEGDSAPRLHHGARLGMGTDLFEERYHPMQNREFEFRADIVKPIDQLRSATSINAETSLTVGIRLWV